MEIRENESLKPKTTMRIGGEARYFAELKTEEDAKKAHRFAKDKGLPLIILGSGANTVFAEGAIEALVVRVQADDVEIKENSAKVNAGKSLAALVNGLADLGLDLSPLAGIPGTVGGAIFGNAGQGPKGIWIDSFIDNVKVFLDGEWKIFSREECKFSYRESLFKKLTANGQLPIIWEAQLTVPLRESNEIKAEIDGLLQKRIETQPHTKTAGSCFKAAPDGTPAWKLIDEAELGGLKIGGVEVSEKHANFLINTNGGTFNDVIEIVKQVQDKAPQLQGVEMRLIDKDGRAVK